MKSFFKKLGAMLLASLVMFTISISAFAATIKSDKITIAADIAAFGTFTDKQVALTKGSSGSIPYIYAQIDDTSTSVELVASEGYAKLSVTDKQLQLQEALNKVGSMGLSATSAAIVEKWAKSLGATDADLLTSLFSKTKADLFTAMKWFSPFQGTLGLILGIGVIFIIVLLIASTVFDLVYIGLPMARNALNNKADGDGKDRPFGISTDALRVVEECEGTTNGGKGKGGNMYVAYFKKRVLTYIILAVCILYLVSGQLAGVIGWLLGQVSGIGG